MMEEIESQFLKVVEELDAKIVQPSTRFLRTRAKKVFADLGLPAKKNEAFQYVPLRHLYSDRIENAFYEQKAISIESIQKYILPETKNSYIVFIGGKLSLELSDISSLPQQLVAMPLSEGALSFQGLLHSRWEQSLKEEKDWVAALNALLHEEGLFLYLPPKTICETPLQILYFNEEMKKTVAMPRIQLFAGAFSDIKIIETYGFLQTEKGWLSTSIELVQDEASAVRIEQVNLIPQELFFTTTLRATLGKRALLKTVSATQGSRSVRNDLQVRLVGEEAQAYLAGVWVLKNQTQAHTHVLIEHQKPHCISSQLFKGALYDLARSSFEGKIYVHPIAQKTEAYQVNHNLVLSDHAYASAKPNLEIFADDVKASHGATVGKFDPEELFYLRTRGIPQEEAKAMLLKGFTQEVLSLFSVPSSTIALG